MGDSLVIGETIQFGENNVNQYLAIPHAEPPVGNLRFKPTVPLKGFPQILQAKYMPPACHQYTDMPFPWYFNDPIKSENCLYLNIWTPADASPQNPKPVLFWIPSGQFRFGSTTLSFYSGLVLSSEGNVIVVTIGYRLGSFGFLYTSTDDAPGNAGLWDILTGLRWVKNNIGYFGGDPSQITIGGESSSAVIVGRITESPLVTWLYSRLIMESGSPANLQTEFSGINLKQSKELAKKLGCATEDIGDLQVNQCLKNVPADVLEKTEYEVFPGRGGDFYPIYGDELNPTNPRRDLTILESDKLGFFGDKNTPFTREIALDATNKFIEFHPDLQSAEKYYVPALDLESVLKNKVYERVPDDDTHLFRHDIYTGFGDLDLVCPTVYFADQCAKQGNDVYYYNFVHRYNSSPFAPWMGVTHFSELQFVFGLPFLYTSYYTEEERKLSRQIISYWTNFVKYGQPDPEWPTYTEDNPIYKVIGSENAPENCIQLRLTTKQLATPHNAGTPLLLRNPLEDSLLVYDSDYASDLVPCSLRLPFFYSFREAADNLLAN
ncbi:acetylcholinesterase-like [Argiope bruennichi]|uniref:acetylcholinesterase-like n=1 Tax=Argiope bruennichi TaxID=94029 RepID=UPI002493DF5E|nr:acetylcholinesterase-like [Argiope bruennichi]